MTGRHASSVTAAGLDRVAGGRRRAAAVALCAGLAATGPQSLALADDVPVVAAGSTAATGIATAADRTAAMSGAAAKEDATVVNSAVQPAGGPVTGSAPVPPADPAPAAADSGAGGPGGAVSVDGTAGTPANTGIANTGTTNKGPADIETADTASTAGPVPADTPMIDAAGAIRTPAATPAPASPPESASAPASTRARAVPPPARASLLPLAQPLWSDLTPSQQAVLAPFAAQWNSWPAQEKLNWVSLADRVPRMKPEAREKASQRIREWAQLTPEQRRLARQNYRLARRLPPGERLERWQRYQQLTPEQQSVLRTSGWTSNTAARHAGARTGLAKEAAQPLSASKYTPPATTTRPPPKIQ